MLKLDNVEFYISNTCNLACNNCNSFNNFAFKGHQQWKDVAEDYRRWSEILDIDDISILGGEPTLNPSLIEWLEGLRKLWPRSGIRITTNGSRLKYHPTLIDECRRLNIKIKISLHSKVLATQVFNDLDNLLQDPINIEYVFRDYHLKGWRETYDKIRGELWPNCEQPHEFHLLPDWIQKECSELFNFSFDSWQAEQASRFITDASGLQVEINWYDKFNDSAVVIDDSGNLSLHDSDPAKAVKTCSMKFCHKFNLGKLYKCTLVTVLPDFVKQFPVKMTTEESEILAAYEPAKHDWDNGKISDFIDSLNAGSYIPQCRFCPESYTIKDIGECTVKPKTTRIIGA